MSVGPPIDVKTGYDLMTKQGQEDTWQIMRDGNPLITFLAPPCTAWSPLSNTTPPEERNGSATLPIL